MTAALDESIASTWSLMEEIGRRTRGVVGITRPAYGAAGHLAATMTESAAMAAGLAVRFDGFGNLHAMAPGRCVGLPAIGMGSHFDSVPEGGNYDGLAGVMAGLAVLSAAQATGVALDRSLHLVGLHGEESPWFGTAYLGSRLALGHAPFAQLGALTRYDTGRTLADHLQDLGFNGEPTVAPVLSPANLACWLELHIEQGPLLIEQNVPIGIATAIRGNVRHPTAKCIGGWAHSAAVPRAHRQDAVLAVADLLMRIDAFWTHRLGLGDDNFVFTVGQFSTNPEFHAMTKVPGEVSFTLNFGATVKQTMVQATALVREAIAEIEATRHVRFVLGEDTGTDPTPLDSGLIDALERSAGALGLGSHRMPTVGHDAGMFAKAGIPAAMVMVRNQNGSHNPAEALEQVDYAAGVRVLAATALQLAGAAD